MGIFETSSPMVSVKKSTIFSSVFFSKIGLEIKLSYGPERKKAFDDDKNVNFLKSKKWVFSKGVHPWFWSKNPRFFLNVFFSKIGLEIMFTYSLKRKEAFEDDKNVNFCEVQKMGILQRGSPMVSFKKSRIFSSVFFSKIGLEIMFSYGLERKEAFEDDKKSIF